VRINSNRPVVPLAFAASAIFSVVAALGGCSGDSVGKLAQRDVVAGTATVTPVTRGALPDAPGPVAIAPPVTTDASDGASVPPASDPSSVASGGVPAMLRSGKPLKIGLLLPLGGFDQTAQIAKGMKQAAEMALFEAEGANVQLIVKDDKGTADGARVAAEDAIKDGAEILLGPLFARAVAGAAPIARAANVPVLSFSNDRQVAGNGVYVTGFLPEQDAERIVSYAVLQGKKRFAAILPDDGYGQVIGAAFRSAVGQAGGTLVQAETYPAGANAMIGPSRRIVELVRSSEAAGSPIDAVFVPGGQDVLPQLGPLLAYAGFDATKVKLIGSGTWEFANVGTTDIFVGGWYPGPEPSGWRQFTGRFIKAYGQPPPRMASVAFDAVGIAIALGGEQPGQRFTAANLTRPSGFVGVDGTLRLTSAGLTERALAVLEVQKMGSAVIDAPIATLDRAKMTAAHPSRVN
jgi:ABC-type branched-subunit amino acid transport system substrate-binding protein